MQIHCAHLAQHLQTAFVAAEAIIFTAINVWLVVLQEQFSPCQLQQHVRLKSHVIVVRQASITTLRHPLASSLVLLEDMEQQMQRLCVRIKIPVFRVPTRCVHPVQLLLIVIAVVELTISITTNA